MARSKKIEEKPKDSGSLQISVEDFVRTRNSVVTGLATLQSAVSDLSRAYIAHTDTVIGRGNASSLEQLNISNPLSGENVLFGQRGPTPAPTTEPAPENKKRKRAPHDKNAPKRALTPFFLYLQTARSTIAAEMGAGKTAKEVQDEGGKRWREMTDDDKKEWQDKYAVNFARYKAQMKSYKAGEGIPEISDSEARKIYDETKKAGKLPSPADLDLGHADEEEEDEEEEVQDQEVVGGGKNDSDSGVEEEEEEEEEEESPEPIKAPPPKRSKTAKDSKTPSKQTPVKEAEPIVTERSTKSPEKKKKGSKKKAVVESVESKKEVVTESASSPPKAASPEKQKKGKGKKRKSEPS